MNTGKAIAVLGAKGGVGTTTIAANLAAELRADASRGVVLVDLNLFLGDVGVHIGVEAGPTVLQVIAQGGVDADALARHPLGFSVLGLASDLSAGVPIRRRSAPGHLRATAVAHRSQATTSGAVPARNSRHARAGGHQPRPCRLRRESRCGSTSHRPHRNCANSQCLGGQSGSPDGEKATSGALSQRKCHTRLHTDHSTCAILNLPEGTGTGEESRGPR